MKGSCSDFPCHCASTTYWEWAKKDSTSLFFNFLSVTTQCEVYGFIQSWIIADLACFIFITPVWDMLLITQAKGLIASSFFFLKGYCRNISPVRETPTGYKVPEDKGQAPMHPLSSSSHGLHQSSSSFPQDIHLTQVGLQHPCVAVNHRDSH